MECVRAYEAPDSEYQIVWAEEEEDIGLSEVRSICNMDDTEQKVHAMAVKLME